MLTGTAGLTGRGRTHINFLHPVSLSPAVVEAVVTFIFNFFIKMSNFILRELVTLINDGQVNYMQYVYLSTLR